MELDEMPNAVAPRIAGSSLCGGLLIASLLIEALTPRPAWPQQTLLKDVLEHLAGSVTVTQPLNRTTPGDLAQRMVFDSSTHALAPWATVGLRWHWGTSSSSSESDWGAHAIGALGLRWRRPSFRATLGLSQDAVYTGFVMEGPSGTVTDSIQDYATQTGYVMEAVTDITGTASWHAGRVTVGGATGWRLAGPARHQLWYSADISTSLTQSLAVVAGVDRRHGRVEGASPHRLTLGLQWRWVPPGRRSRAAPARPGSASPRRERRPRMAVHRIQDSIRLRLIATPATQVEVRGDLTKWMPTPMERSGDDAWRLTLPASPGVHRLAMRIDDGAWLPPPGWPVGTDGYDGKVGLFTVKP